MRKPEGPCYGLLIAVIFLTSCVGAEDDAEIKRLCEENDKTCKQCISAHPMCSWCGDLDDKTLTEPIKRCTLHSQNLVSCTRSGSSNVTVINPASHLIVEKNEPFAVAEDDDAGSSMDDAGSSMDDAGSGMNTTAYNATGNTTPASTLNVEKTEPTGVPVQIRPQNITVKLRKDQPYKLNVTFRKVIDYPLDIYYVMDLSYSMKDDLKVLQDLGTSLFDDLKKSVTENVQLGFGSFVDKVMMPYASTVEKQLDNPCASQKNNTTCATPFGFRHQVSITGDAKTFSKSIQSTNISGNIDIPEGSFDALMQIAVCEQIKWRRGATRVILLTTDATPHVAMDGKLAGILEANDMKCHLEKGVNERLPPDAIVYAKSKTMDYPSLGQLKRAFDANKIHSIFAVTADVKDLYKGIEYILSDAYVAELRTDSSNIIPLINDTYSKLKRNIEFKTSPSLPPHVKQTHKIFCPITPNNTKDDEMKCQEIKINDEVVIEFEFTATECPSDPNHRDQILLTSSSLQDVVTINLEYLCDCDCQSEGFANSSDCSHSGSLTCGVCECDEGKEGSLCQCDAMTNGVSVKDECKMPGSDKYCEDLGFCDCGKCKHCQAPYTGDYCECTTAGCPVTEGGVCGGPEQGYCKDCPGSSDKCRCHEPYSIKTSDGTCSCNPAKCKTSSTNGICDGHGECECDTCKCNKTIWEGSYCQNCVDPECVDVDATCEGEEIRKCALCLTKRDDCADVCNTKPDVLLYEQRSSFLDCDSITCFPSSTSRDCKDCNKHNTSVDKTPCTHLRETDSCKYEYEIIWTKKYRYYVYVKIYDRETDCPADNTLIFAFSGVGAFILIVIVLLVIWKIYTMLRDKRQYQAFQEEQKKRKWTKGENPIFERPEQKFANPMFDANNID